MDIGVKNGIITYLEEHQPLGFPINCKIVDANGNVLLPGFVESHIHLDKAFVLQQLKEEAITVEQAIANTMKLKHSFTIENLEERSVQVIQKAIAHGVTHMRCHVDIDPIMKLTGFEVMLKLKEQFQDALTLQIVAFPQEGIFKQPGTAGWLEQALEQGADVVGGITYNDLDLQKHLHYVFGLAKKFDKPLDLHVDFSDDPQMLAILDVVRLTHEYGMNGRVSVGHLTSLGSVPRAQAKEICKVIAEANIHVMTLPATDLYLNGRGDEYRIRRGLTPIDLLLEQGVNVIYGSNNIQNAFTPFGTADPLDIGLLLAQTTYMGSEQDAKLIIEMITTRAAQALLLQNYGIVIGAHADLVLCDAKDIRNVLYNRSDRLGVWKKGKQVASTEKYVTLFS
jgi:cytosine deaminase